MNYQLSTLSSALLSTVTVTVNDYMYEVKKSSYTLLILTMFLVSLPVSVMMLFIMVSDGLIRFVFRLFLLCIKNQIHILYYDVINPDQAKSC